MRRGSNKFNHCDFSIRVFLYMLEPFLSRVNARITWLSVVAKPYWVIYWKHYRPYSEVRHSVFNIETRSGDEYIADFTIEQFGYSSECWLMRKSEYEKQCTMGIRMRQPRSEEVDEARRGEVKFWHKKAQAIWMVVGVLGERRFFVYVAKTTGLPTNSMTDNEAILLSKHEHPV
ncbi:unnamed protein product [Alternaria burnsii]|nr:unnamed protein product [Alternaria burnsii]